MARQAKPTTRDLTTFGQALRTARLKAEVSQARMAEALGVRQSSVSAWEAGDYEPEREYVFQAEQVLNLEPGVLARLLGYGPPVLISSGRGRTPKAQPGIPPNARQAILLDPALKKPQKDALLAVLRALTSQSRWTAQPAA